MQTPPATSDALLAAVLTTVSDHCVELQGKTVTSRLTLTPFILLPCRCCLQPEYVVQGSLPLLKAVRSA